MWERARSVAAGALGLAMMVASAHAATAPKRRSGPVLNAAGQPLRSPTGQALHYQSTSWRVAPPAALRPRAEDKRLSGPQLGLQPSWNYVAFGANIGGSGLVSATVNGTTEIYAGGSGTTFGPDTYWYALTKVSNGLGEGLKQVFASEEYGAAMVQLTVAKAGAGEQRIVVALEDGTLIQYDAATKQIKERGAGPCASRGGQQAFAVGDLNSDGIDEFVSVCADQTLAVHGPAYTSWTLAGVGGTSLAIAQMDDDAAIEVATNAGKVVDTGTKTVQWTRSGGFGAHVIAGDIDGDGRAELIAADAWYWVNAYEVEKKLPKWSLQAELDIGAIQLADINGDGVKELLLGDGQWGSIHAYDPATLAETGSIGNPEHGVTNILVADVNGDGVSELLWGAGATSTGSDYLYVSTWASKTIEWQNLDLTGPFVGPVAGDLDGDGVPEIVFASWGSEADYDSGRIIVLDGRTLAVRAVSAPVVDNYSWTGLRDLRLADVDGNGRPEILVAADRLYDGALEAYRFTRKNAFVRTAQVIDSETSGFTSVAAADVEGDGSLELMGGSSGFVFAYDPATGSRKWRSPVQMGGSARDLVVADVDADGTLEFTALASGGMPYVHDGLTHALEAIVDLNGTCMSSVMTAGGSHLLVGDASGQVHEVAYQAGSYVDIRQWQAASAAIDGVTVAANGSAWVGSAGRMRAFGAKGKLRYETIDLGGQAGRQVVRLKSVGLDLTAGSRGLHGLTYAAP